jgi:uncharacterized membrane protein
MYTIEIISLLTWPLIIYLTLKVVQFAVKRYERIFPEEG